jgi:hypothetical protein
MTKLTNDKKIALTQAELAYLKSFLDAGDRPVTVTVAITPLLFDDVW